MAKDRHTRDLKRKKKLELRKQQARQTMSLAYTGRKYKTAELVPTLMRAEVGIYETFVMTNRRLLDQTVALALERLIRQLRVGTFAPCEFASEVQYEVGREEDLVIESIRRNWARHFAKETQPSRDKLVGILRTILGSVETMRGAGRSQSYLRHIEGFLTKDLGVSVERHSQGVETALEAPDNEPLKPVPK